MPVAVGLDDRHDPYTGADVRPDRIEIVAEGGTVHDCAGGGKFVHEWFHEEISRGIV
jgi:hypothetical protein